MGVDKARCEKPPFQVHYLPGRVLAEPHHLPSGDGDGLGFNLTRKDIDESGVLQQEINFFVTFG